jgi:DNA-binding transcriptional regulator YdaS (Cro superfamily)
MNRYLDEGIRNYGGGARVAAALGVTRSAVSQWKQAGTVPPKHCRKFERLTGVPCWRVNSLFPRPSDPLAEQPEMARAS